MRPAWLARSKRLIAACGSAGAGGKGRLGPRPAPVAVTYLGYPGTTGLEAIGYRLTDADADPPDTGDADCVETPVRLPAGFLCYRPEADAPEVAEAPCAGSGVVTFGLFNNMAKMNDPLIGAWSEILRREMHSRMTASSLCGRSTVTRGIEDAYRFMWRRWYGQG